MSPCASPAWPAATEEREGEAGAIRTAVGLAAAGTALIAVCYGLARFAYGLFVPTFRSTFGLDAATAGAVAAGSYGAYAVAIVVATAATARWGSRAVAVSAGLLATAGTALVAAAPTAAVLAVGVVLAGSSTGLASPPLAQAVTRVAPPRLEPRLQTVVNAGTGIGVLVSGPVALLLAGQWRWAWGAFSAVALIVTAWTWSTVPRTDRGRRPLAPLRPASALRAARSRLAGRGDPSGPGPLAGERRRLLVAAAAMGLGSAAVWTFGRDLVAFAGGSDTTGVVLWIALGAAGLLGAFAGDLTTRFGLTRCWRVAMLLLAGATALLALGAGTPVLAIAAGASFGAVYIALTGLLLVWGTRAYPERPVFGVGAAFLLIALGQAAGSPLLGALADAVTLPGAFLAAAVVCALGVLAAPVATGARAVAG